MTHIDSLVHDIRTVAQHVAQNYNYQYGPKDAPNTATRVLTTLDVAALDQLIGWVFAVSEMSSRFGELDEAEQAAYGAALRLDDDLRLGCTQGAAPRPIRSWPLVRWLLSQVTLRAC